MRAAHQSLVGFLAMVALSAGCAERAVSPSASSGSATMTIHLTDAPGDVQAAVVTIARVYLQGSGGRTVLRDTPYTVDLVSLATTSTVLLENVQVPAGTYSELRFVVTGAYVAVEQAGGGTQIFASSPDYAGLPPGAVVGGDLQMPSFATSGLKVQLPGDMLSVPATGVVSLVVDFNTAESFGHQAGNSGKWVMHPVITATRVTQGAMLSVTLALGSGVTLPSGITLGDFRATLAAASAPDQVLATAAFGSDGSGTFTAALGFVAPGSYLVNLIVPGALVVTVSPAVPLPYAAVAGPATTLALTLTAASAQSFFASLSAGDYHTCGLTPTGAAYCWGSNSKGKLGDGSTTDRLTPVAVAGGLAFDSLAPGSVQTCGLTASGAAYCWGYNFFGDLGDGTTTDRLTPVPVVGGLTFKSISAGGQHTCGLTPAGVAYCWGRNDYAELGDGTTTQRLTPTPVAGGLTYSSLTAAAEGVSTCGVTPQGAAYCWGLNDHGQIGDGTITERLSPTPVSGGLSFTSLVAASDHTCGLTASGVAYCWGDGFYGQLGDGTGNAHRTPEAVAGGLTFKSLNAGVSYTCGLATTGVAYCWGVNDHGQLGDGTTTNRLSPVPVTGGLTFTSLVGRGTHNCGLTSSGGAYCWGTNNVGQLGDGTTTDRMVPTAVTP